MGAIRGTVIHRHTTEPLEGVELEAKGQSSQTTKSGSDGSFHLPDLTPGEHELTARKDGFDTESFGPLQVFDGDFELRIALGPKQE